MKDSYDIGPLIFLSFLKAKISFQEQPLDKRRSGVQMSFGEHMIPGIKVFIEIIDISAFQE